MKKIILGLSCAFAMASSFAQTGIVKVNLASLAFKNINLSYEHGLTDKMSVNVQASYMLPYTGEAFSNAVGADTSLNISDFKFGGYAITPEIRFYTKGEGMSGFYYSFYLRHFNYKSNAFSSSVSVNDSTLGNATLQLKRYMAIRPGAQIGYQWLIGDVFSIDWFFGANVGLQNTGISVSSPDIDPADFTNGQIDEIGLPRTAGLKFDVTQGNIKGSLNRWASFGVRSGITLGYAF